MVTYRFRKPILYRMIIDQAPPEGAVQREVPTAMSVLPFDDRDGVIWFDGKLVPWREAKMHVLTHALHYASCVFEGERAYGGQVFKLTEHSERLVKSADILGFKIPYSVAEIDAATNQV